MICLVLRSPWSNEYNPPLEDGVVPPPKLRALELDANEKFDKYRELCDVKCILD